MTDQPRAGFVVTRAHYDANGVRIIDEVRLLSVRVGEITAASNPPAAQRDIIERMAALPDGSVSISGDYDADGA